MFGSRTAAAADDSDTERFHLIGKRRKHIGADVVDGLAGDDLRQTGIRLGKQPGIGACGLHRADDGFEAVGTDAAIRADRHRTGIGELMIRNCFSEGLRNGASRGVNE